MRLLADLGSVGSNGRVLALWGTAAQWSYGNQELVLPCSAQVCELETLCRHCEFIGRALHVPRYDSHWLKTKAWSAEPVWDRVHFGQLGIIVC